MRIREHIGPIAIVDVGSYFTRLEIVQVTDNNRYETLESLTQTVPMGINVFSKGRISVANTELMGKIMKNFSQIIKEYGVTHLKAVATSAVREAANSELFIDSVLRSSGIKLKILDSSEEIRIMFQAVKEDIQDKFTFAEKNSMLCVVGTGSTQVSLIEKGVLKRSESLPIGSLRLREKLSRPAGPRKLRDVVDPFINRTLKNIISQSSIVWTPDLFIIVGASARALIRFIKRDNKKDPALQSTISKKDFAKIYSTIVTLSPPEIAEQYNISDTLAESLEPFCDIVFNMFKLSKTDSLIISHVSTRDAILEDFLREIRKKTDPFINDLFSCAEKLGERYKYDKKHGKAVVKVALKIFDSTSELHLIGKNGRNILKVAAILHDIGLYINTSQHHKHSYYLIKNSQIPGLGKREQNIIATIARYHRRALPKKSHPEYTSLSYQDKVLVSKLAAILRVADSLDFIIEGQIKEIKVNKKKRLLEIITDGPIDYGLEEWSIKKKADLFKEVFGLKMSLLRK